MARQRRDGFGAELVVIMDPPKLVAPADGGKAEIPQYSEMSAINATALLRFKGDSLQQVLDMGCWTPVERFGLDGDFDWTARLHAADGSHFDVLHRGVVVGTVRWSLSGRHSVMNGLAAIAAAERGRDLRDARFGDTDVRLLTKRVASASKNTAVGIALTNERLCPLPDRLCTALPRSVAAAAR